MNCWRQSRKAAIPASNFVSQISLNPPEPYKGRSCFRSVEILVFFINKTILEEYCCYFLCQFYSQIFIFKITLLRGGALDTEVNQPCLVLCQHFNIGEVSVRNQFVLVQHEVDLPAEAGEKEDGLPPGGINLVPVYRDRWKTS